MKKFHIFNFLFCDFIVLVIMFEKFRKSNDDEIKESRFENRSQSEIEDLPKETLEEKTFEPQEPVNIVEETTTSSEIGITALMDKRAKLEDAIDYVGLLIKNLKDKRTKLEKEIEDESVDIKNLKEKLMKVGEYIEEENRGIRELTQKRTNVEKDADEVATIISELKDKLSNIDNVVDEEGNKIKSFREKRDSS